MQVSVDVRDDAGAHRRRTLAQAAAWLVGAAVWVVAGLLLARTTVPELDLPELDPRRYFSGEALERADRFRAVTRVLWAASVALEIAVLALVVWRARPLARAVGRLAYGRVRTGAGVGLLAVGATWLVTLPLAGTRHWWNRRYDLSRQGWDGWLGDRALALGVRAFLVAIVVAGAVWLAGRLGGRWWLAAAPALVALAAAYVLAQPLVVQPLFNRFQPLPDRTLAAEVERLGARIGVEVETVQVADASRRTTAANAYVAGIGPTRRVVFWDTILDGRFSDRELASVAAHELAHVERRHLWKGIAWFALLAVPGLALVARVTERRGGLRDPALAPLGLLVALAVFLLTLPLQNAVSRRYEAEADWIALRATEDPDAAIALDRRLTVTSLGDPDPPAWARFVLSTHPPTLERIAMAEASRTRLRTKH
jgi:STE24 endopeptidase